ncbi:1,6-anhydro-N-acetylmuramyl-L-alanine amidase AmpD [Ralstonia insidiosa]|jgi:AmpD protein|uniref:1,6-anhydro-N-acetylmuramyl-L-alanine amidase AmpD n=1 Tax=Ralstonia TaxID=48736 RepID=UPI0006648758|nr:1,6-anhydro-N-acetylmuramyl-L-alanine amidase AmpD [Ralstonia insidiosa]KMW47471.1 N-acetyl-anhydromuranmyl-L-alanine amidase [Ralstonia sp. MD27]MBX3773720.1 1,6-anhydro-N-acetylmuramyl-L-alanine amidase AmpD [Ralstonia pickettii]NOZ17660.1 1,6-anhydro-N-acetylmuramyl-L-alanine amidase AmpD [Betaproteobacteria bacterium]MBA9857497.1 1,6-anhydro-N-acetylmuramyl-L-alanine amidase AmpD [Ralstonia insidiosa]MBA9870828.1 1,6-anhydro-N-acetylmuramyl-L-alanine amidase AmpD [Ralstonia insidiosa]
MPDHNALRVDAAGWVEGVRRHPSPNIDERPEGMPIDLIVLHNISLPPAQSATDFGTDDVLDFFTNTLDCDAHPYFDQLRGVRVSAHFFVRRTGECVQFAPCGARAWHAGASDFFGRTRCNDFSVGIEIEGTDDLPFTPEQYATTASLVRAICAAYPIAAIAGHSDIAPGRKTDPGPCFDWAHLRALGGFNAALFPYQHAL